MLSTAANLSPVYLVDTNIVIHYVRGDALEQQIEAKYSLTTSTRRPLLSIVTHGELHSLALRWNWGAARHTSLNLIISRFVALPLEYPGVVERYAQIEDFSRRNGRAMSKNDTWIAATASVTGAKLLTTDADFDHLDPTYLSRDCINPAGI